MSSLFSSKMLYKRVQIPVSLLFTTVTGIIFFWDFFPETYLLGNIGFPRPPWGQLHPSPSSRGVFGERKCVQRGRVCKRLTGEVGGLRGCMSGRRSDRM